MPRLISGPREGNVEADFDDPIIGAEHRFAHRDEPWMSRNRDEPADPFRLDLDVPALGSARKNPAFQCARFREQGFNVFAQLVREGRAESFGERRNSVAVDRAHDRGIILAHWQLLSMMLRNAGQAVHHKPFGYRC